MEKSQITIFAGESEDSIMERLRFSLMEIGVKTKRLTMHDDYVIYELVREERLGPPKTDKE
jgi:hypothetical protein